jgi:predicted RNA-binding protein with PUA domain
MEADSDWQDQHVRKILKAVIISGSASTNPIYCEGKLFYKFKYENVMKMKNKPDPELSGASYLFNEIKKGHKNIARLSL